MIKGCLEEIATPNIAREWDERRRRDSTSVSTLSSMGSERTASSEVVVGKAM